ncbi:MAG: Flagellar hook-basal body complex protein fliE [Firmicutes bacterium]|nr:Flagellar hook-basal body complex protein fliE [Bacillota bacterium]
MKVDSLYLSPVKLQNTMVNSNNATNTDEQNLKFSDVLSNVLSDVNQLQLKANHSSVDLAAGKVQDISEAVIATEKATIALQLTMQVRNKIVDAYQEVMRMQV